MSSITFNGITIGDGTNFIYDIFKMDNSDINRQQVKTYGKHGANINNVTYGIKTISVSGTMCANSQSELESMKIELMNGFDGITESKLTYKKSNLFSEWFEATAIADIPDFGETQEGFTLSFGVVFTIPNFFIDSYAISNFDFSSTTRTIQVKGIETKPKIVINPHNNSPSPLTISNQNNESISINTDFSDILTIDLKTETATLQNGDDFSENVSFNGFKLYHGLNTVNYTYTEFNPFVRIEFFERYIGV